MNPIKDKIIGLIGIMIFAIIPFVIIGILR
jgi:hypothetical protein